MCKHSRWVIKSASVFGMIQSLIWMGLGVGAALVYLCVIPVAYKGESDFFKVTLVKLYFEGPGCIPDGSYLGEFSKDYKNLNLFKPDKVFVVMISYAILNAIYFLISVMFYRNRAKNSKRISALAWSFMTLVQCGIDVILAYKFINDIFTLQDHMPPDKRPINFITSSASRNLVDVPYIPLVLALISSRFIAIWIWNFIVGLVLLMDSLFFKKITRDSKKKKQEKEPEKKPEAPQQPSVEEPTPSISLFNGKSTNTFDVRANPDFIDYKTSADAISRFSHVFGGPTYPCKENFNRAWSYTPTEAYWNPSKPHSSKEWEMTNEGYVHDEPEFVETENSPDFDHNLKNFQSGPRKIKIVKPPIGKPVSIPVPPPFPASGSCNC